MIKGTKEYIKKIYKPIVADTHKGIQGHALLIGGSYGKIGSISLSSKAALKSGCGLVTAFIPKCGYTILQTAIPEVMVLVDEEEKVISKIQYDFEPKAIGIGMGIGQDFLTEKAFYNFIINNKTPLVVDADGLNILAKHQSFMFFLPEKTILTPHQKELERLVGTWENEWEMIEKAILLSKEHNFIIILKGSHTKIIDGDFIYENPSGNQALATAGSGDVLTGIITSLLAQHYDPREAAILGVYIHGLTADIAKSEICYPSFIASDIIAYLGKAFFELY